MHYLDAKTHNYSYLAEEQAGFHLSYHMENHQMLLKYLLLVASRHWGPLALAFIDLIKVCDQLPRVAFWHTLAEDMEVPKDIRTGIEALYY